MHYPFAQLLCSILFCACALYNYLDNFNDLTRLRLRVPELHRELNVHKLKQQELNHAWLELCSAQNLLKLKEQAGLHHLRYWSVPEPLAPAHEPQ